jgi:hypothetical protein
VKPSDLPVYIPYIALTTLVVCRIIANTRREAALRALARQHGFTYIGKALSRSLTSAAAALGRVDSVENVIDGDCHGFRIALFDYRVGRGKGSYVRTAIATKGCTDHSAVLELSPGLAVARSNEWTILYEPRNYGLRRMSPELLNQCLEKFAC